jgi:hypothetical protein
MIADTPECFAAKCVAILTNSTLRSRIVGASRELVVAAHDWDVITKRLVEMLSMPARHCQAILPPVEIQQQLG